MARTEDQGSANASPSPGFMAGTEGQSDLVERLKAWLARGNPPGGMNVRSHDGTPSIREDLRALLTAVQSSRFPAATPLDREAVARIIDSTGHGYQIHLERLVDGVSTYSAQIEGGERKEFGSHGEAFSYVQTVRTLSKADQIIALAAAIPGSADGGWQPIETAPQRVPDDVAELVVAARTVAFDDQSAEALKRLDEASEAFASRVPWDDEPNPREDQ